MATVIKRMQLALMCLGYIAAFLWGYVAVVSPAFAYEGLTYSWPGWAMMCWVLLLCLVPLLVMPLRLTRPSVVFAWWIYISAYISAMILPVLILSLSARALLPLQLSLLACMLILAKAPSFPTLIIPQFRMNASNFFPLIWIFWIVYAGILLSTGLAAKIPGNLAMLFAGESEYTVRGDFFARISQLGYWMAYVSSAVSNVINPFFIACGLIYKRRPLLILGVLWQLTLAAMAGVKGIVFLVIFIWIIYLAMKYTRRNFGLALLTGVTVAVILCTAIDLAQGTHGLSKGLTRRTLAVPGQLTAFYFEHYSLIPHTGHVSQQGNVQVYAAAQEIGRVYFGSELVDANANGWASGFAEYGLPGIFLSTLEIALFVWLFDSISARRPLEMPVLMCCASAFGFTESAPLTVLLTHSGLVAALLLYLSSSWEDALQPSYGVAVPDQELQPWEVPAPDEQPSLVR